MGLARGKDLKALATPLAESVDEDLRVVPASETFGIPEETVRDEQVENAGEKMVREALWPFYDPALRNRVLKIATASEQVLDEFTPDQLLEAGFDEAAAEKARGMVEGFRGFIEKNRGEIEALKVLYSRPHRSGLRFRQVKELAKTIERP